MTSEADTPIEPRNASTAAMRHGIQGVIRIQILLNWLTLSFPRRPACRKKDRIKEAFAFSVLNKRLCLGCSAEFLCEPALGGVRTQLITKIL
jgi:hypothetical protein